MALFWIPSLLAGVVLTASACAASAPASPSAPPREAAMTSPRLPEASELAGAWTISHHDRSCRVQFLVDRIETANAQALGEGQACLDGIGLGGVIAWRAATDGLELVGSNSLPIAFLAHDGQGGYVGPPGQTSIRVRRAAD